MAIYFYSNNELVLYELGDTLTSPIRAEFLVSDDLNETIEVTIEFADDEIEDLVLPFVATIEEKHYYSFPHKLIKSLDNTIPGVDEETPTPTITPTLSECVSSPVTITVESEYIGTGNSVYKYITSDSSGAGGLFGCIDVERGSTLTIFVDGDEPNLVSHPLKITNYNDQGQEMAPVDGVVKTDLTSGSTEDHTYSLTWVVPCDETIDKYQYQCEEHAHMRGTINVFGKCEHTPTPSPTHTPTVTIFDEEPIDEYIYDSMEAVSIIGGPDGNSSAGDNDRSLTTIQGVNGVTGLTLENNIVTLTETGRYYIKARSNAYRPHKVFTRIRFLSGDYENETFDGISRFAWADEPDEIVSETSVVVDITQTTTFKIQTNVENGGVSGGIDGGATLFVQKLASADGGSDNSSTTPQFCNVAGLATSQTISHSTGTNINFDGDLTTGSQNWRTYNEDLEINVIEPGEAGYYNVNGAVWIGSTGSTAESMIDVTYAQLYLHKYNKTTKTETLLIKDYRGKATAGGWVHLQPQITANNVHLETDDVLYLRVFIWKHQNHDVKHKFGDNSTATYFQVEKSNAISSSSAGSSSNGSIGGMVHAVFDGNANIVSKSSNWDTYINSITFPSGETFDGYARINYKNAFTSLPNVQVTADHIDGATNPHVFGQVQAQHLDRCDVIIGNSDNVKVTTGFSVTIFSDEITNGSSSSDSSSTFASLTDTPSELSAGKYIKVNDAGNGIEFVDAPSGGSGGNYEFCTVGISGTQNFSNNYTWVNFNGNLTTGSTDLTYLVSSINANGLRPSEDGYYDINTAIKIKSSSVNAMTNEMHIFVYRHDIDTGNNTLIGSGTEFWNDEGGWNGAKCQVNVPDVYLTTNNVILIRLLGWRNDTNFSVALETGLHHTHLNLSRSDIGGGSGGSSAIGSNIVTGNYTGNGEASQTIELGFRPAMVHVKCTSAPYYAEMTQIDGLEGTSLRSYHTVNHSDDGHKIEITNTGFTATGNTNNSTFNHNGSEYYYYAIASATLDSSSSGGSSSSVGSVGTSEPITSKSNFDGILPDVIFEQHESAGYDRALYLTHINTTSNLIWYQSNYSNGDFQLTFNNDTDGTSPSDAGSKVRSSYYGNNLKDYISLGKAVFFGGGGSSSGGSSSSSSAVLPSSSILQKVSTSMSSKSNVGANTTLISLDYTPKVAGSKLICTFNCNYQEQRDSQQYGQFFKNGVGFGSTYYCYTPDQDNRDMVTLISETTVDDLSPMTIDVRTLSSAKDNVDYRTLFMSVEEISTTEYILGSSSNNTSSSGGSQIIFKTKYGAEKQTTTYPKDTDNIINFTNIDIDKYNAYNSENGYFVAPHDMQIGVNAYSNIAYNSSDATRRSYLAILTKDTEDVTKMITRQSDIHEVNAYGGSLSASAYISLKQGESMYATFKHFGTTTNINVSTAMTIVEL